MNVSVTSGPFEAKHATTANWSGAAISKGQKIRRWEIGGEESYEPESLSRIIGMVEDGRAGKVEDAEHAGDLVREYGRENVFFVTEVHRRSVTTKQKKASWSRGQFDVYLGRHAILYFLHDDAQVGAGREMLRDRVEESAERQNYRNKEYAVDYGKHVRDEEDLGVTDQEIEKIVEEVYANHDGEPN